MNNNRSAYPGEYPFDGDPVMEQTSVLLKGSPFGVRIYDGTTKDFAIFSMYVSFAVTSAVATIIAELRILVAGGSTHRLDRISPLVSGRYYKFDVLTYLDTTNYLEIEVTNHALNDPITVNHTYIKYPSLGAI